MNVESTWPARRPLIIGLFSLLVLAGGAGSRPVLSPLSGAVAATGRIKADRNRQVVQHLDRGSPSS
ncbi:hypothetical protein [Leisingera thetidis]|uniref:hypothetical protein n=1 Tax=Leisingera thetidis TaxID=2930199 RepID=UPI0021F789F3|nr:hypothetical protein [Leisingera thetidis]